MADAVALLERSYGTLAQIAAFRGASTDEVEAVVRETVLAVLSSDDRGRTEDLRRRLFHELAFRVAARERAAGRSVVVEPGADPEPAVADDRFEPAASRWADFFFELPPSFDALRPDGARAVRARAVAAEAVAELPLGNRMVVVLRDVAGWSAEEVAGLLGVDLESQRIALHGARARIRRALERLAREDDG